MSADDFLLFFVARLPIQHGGRSTCFPYFKTENIKEKTAIVTFLNFYC